MAECNRTMNFLVFITASICIGNIRVGLLPQVAELTPAAPPRILLCLFGVIPRSITKTWATIDRRIVKVLEGSGHAVEIYVFNLDVGTAKIDGVPLDQKDIEIVPYTFKEVETQVSADEIINRSCRNCDRLYSYGPLTVPPSRNAVRALYSESRTGAFVASHAREYAAVVVCGPDFYLLRDINTKHVEAAIKDSNILFVSPNNPAMGYTNGYYIGSPYSVSRILNRFEDKEKEADRNTLTPNDDNVIIVATCVDKSTRRNVSGHSSKLSCEGDGHIWLTYIDYEYYVKRKVERENLTLHFTDMMFCKVRANCSNAVWNVWCGGAGQEKMALILKAKKCGTFK